MEYIYIKCFISNPENIFKKGEIIFRHKGGITFDQYL